MENLNPAAIATDILNHHDNDNDGAITAEEFQVWAVKNSLPDDFYKLLFQVSLEVAKWRCIQCTSKSAALNTFRGYLGYRCFETKCVV